MNCKKFYCTLQLHLMTALRYPHCATFDIAMRYVMLSHLERRVGRKVRKL